MSQSAEQPVIPVREFFTLDVRSLALFRVALAVFILLDWVDRLPDMRVHYSDEGILPRALISGVQPFSLHMLSGAPWVQGTIFVFGMAFSLLLLVGWRTPWVCLINFAFLASVHARNPALVQGGDYLLRILTFWSIFLPLGACWSVDASRSRVRPSTPGVLSPGSVALIVQLCIVYWFAAAWKWLGPWRDEGTAVYLALHVDHFPTRLGLVLREYPDLCWLLTHATIWLETLGPVLLLLPFNVGLQRMVTIASFILFHAGLALTMELGHFPFVCMIAWLPLLPGGFWNRLAPRLRTADTANHTLVIEQQRPRAARRLACLRTFLFLGEIPLRDVSRQRGGWALLDGEKELLASDALARLFALSPLRVPLAGRLSPWLVRWLSVPGGTRSEEAVPRWAPPSGLMANTLAVFFLVYIVGFNVFQFSGGQARLLPPEARAWLPQVPDQYSQLGSALGLEQGWGLFAPQPGRHVGWFVVVGKQKNGRVVDAYNGGPLSWDKPEFLTLTYESGRWRKLRMNLAAMSVFPNLLPGFTRYYFEEWNRHHDGPEQLSSIEVWWMYEVTVAPGENPPAPEKILLGRYSPVVPAAPKGTVVVVGTLDDGQMIDLMRAGAPLTAASLDREPNGPIISPAYGPLTAIANSGAEKYVVGGFARFLLDDWNKANPERRVEKVEILRVQPGQRETLAEASR